MTQHISARQHRQAGGVLYSLLMPADDEERFLLKYEGVALVDHSIDVTDLAPALLGLSELVDEANHVINRDRTSISLRIKATEPGCFQVEIHAIQSVANAAVDFLTGKEITALVALLTLLGFATDTGRAVLNSVIEVIRRLRGRPPKSVTPLQDGAEVELELPTGEKLRVERGVWEICISQKARTAIQKIVKPLQKEGIEELEVIRERETTTRITKSEAPYFAAPEETQEELQVSERITHVNIVSLWFEKEHKWRLNEGGNVFYATISDVEFIKKTLANEEAFRAGDLFKVKLRQTQYRTSTGLKSEWEVVEVIEHLGGAAQIPLL
jgi:hypothetical protein